MPTNSYVAQVPPRGNRRTSRSWHPDRDAADSPIVEDHGEFRITVEFNNIKHDGHWVLRPGLDAELVIEAAEADVAGLRQAAATSQQPAVEATADK